MADTIYLIRHAEKPLGAGPPHGVDIDGNQDPESLTPRGWQRAGAIVSLFGGGPAGSSADAAPFPPPTHLFASLVGAGSSSRRPRQTLDPLAERLGLEVDTRFLKPQIAELAAAAVATDGVVLIAWEHHLIPALTSAILGSASGLPTIWPDDRYDMVWIVDVATRAFRQVPQLLLAGDRPDTFPL